MKITSIAIAKLQIPLIRPFITAVRQTNHVEDVVVMIKTDCGNIGYGSAASTPAITGDTTESIIAAIKDNIAPRLIGKSISEFNSLFAIVDNSLQKNTSPKAAIDIALHDLFAKQCNLPLYKMLGGSNKTINTCITISVKKPEEMVHDAILLTNSGFNLIKIKLGLNPDEDIARVKAIRQALGFDIRLLVDANQGWNHKDAIRIINTLEEFKIEIIEQPVKANDLIDLKHITDTSSSFIMADEACFSINDAMNIATNHYADGINIKLMKSGGIANANSIYNIARASNLGVMVGCMLESPIGVAAIASFALSKSDIMYADLDPIALIKENYVLGGAKLVGNQVILSDKPGLGIEGFSQGLTHICEIK